MYCERSPRLIGFQLLPPSSVRKAHAFELAGMLRAVIPLMRGERFAGCVRGVVDKLVARGLRGTGGRRLSGRRSGLMPGFAAVIGALNDLPKPATGLRCIQAIRIGGRSLEMVKFPAREMRTADV